MTQKDLCNIPENVLDATVEWTNNSIIQPIKTFYHDIAEDYNSYDKYNESEEKVLESNYFSSYKGVPVFRINYERSGSFGAIFLSMDADDRDYPEDEVRHEYGHTKQLEQLGVIKYALCIGLPSWQKWGSDEYYDKPWEITADIYGEVESRPDPRPDVESKIDAGYRYLELSKHIGPLVWLFIE